MIKRNFEQGPIRPPSEAQSLLLRVSRNCPWNRCEFCHIYKKEKFSLRTFDEIKEDIDNIRDIVKEIKEYSWKAGFGGEIDAVLVNNILQNPKYYPDGYRSVALWLYGGGKNVFLQDADSLILKTDQLVKMLKYLKETFPTIERITTYGRAKTISKKDINELIELFNAGLSRIHIGLESGYDYLLEYMRKGVTSKEHIEAGRKVKESGISLSEYVILGLGGKRFWKEHAIETAKVLNQINPDFIRVRTLKVLKIMPLYQKIEDGDFILLNDDEIISEERLLIENLEGITSIFKSDHILNLLEEVEGKLPEDKGEMLSVIDRYLSLSEEEKRNFKLGRRAGLYRSLKDLTNPSLRSEVDRALRKIDHNDPKGLERVLSELTDAYI